MVVTAKGVTRTEIETFVALDPAVQSGLLHFEIRLWYTTMIRMA